MYYKLSYASEGALPLKILVLYIYIDREAQCNTTNNHTSIQYLATRLSPTPCNKNNKNLTQSYSKL
jgi:hypothetical protein